MHAMKKKVCRDFKRNLYHNRNLLTPFPMKILKDPGIISLIARLSQKDPSGKLAKLIGLFSERKKII